MERLFGTDGIRGSIGEWPLVPEFFLKLGLAAGLVLKKEVGAGNLQKDTTMIIGRDTRRSGAMLQSALSAGLLAAGVHVIDAGIIPTPGVAWLVRYLNIDAGCVISASHNPVEQNGVKFFNNGGRKLSENIEDEIEKLVHSDHLDVWEKPVSEHIGRMMDGKFSHEFYIQGLIAEHPGLKMDSLKIVVDCANGAASQFAPEVLGRFGAKVVTIHASPTGLNINVGSDHKCKFMYLGSNFK